MTMTGNSDIMNDIMNDTLASLDAILDISQPGISVLRDVIMKDDSSNTHDISIGNPIGFKLLASLNITI